MLVIDKHKVADWMLLSYLAEQNELHEKILHYEKKYSLSFYEFENVNRQSENENFEEWDDLIEREAYTHFHKKLTKTTNDSRNNNHR